MDLFSGNLKRCDAPKVCGICGDPHFYRECKYVVIGAKVLDKPVPSRALLSLPDSLEIKKLADETHSVFTKGFVEVGTEFGPFIAKKNLTLHPAALFPIKLFITNESDLSEYYLDTTDENECCWMMFVKPAGDIEEQNLICYQEGDHIFFGAMRDIQPGEELRVWYSPYCAFKMQKNILTFKDSSKMQFELDVKSNDTDDLNMLIKEQQKIIPRVVWNCKFCYKLEKNVTDFAKHLLTHYAPQNKRTCTHCQKRFRYMTDYQKHLKLFHNEPKIQTEAPQTTVKVLEQPKPQEHLKTSVGGPLLLQGLTDSLDHSNSLLQQPEMNLFDLENYDPHLLFDDNLRLNVDVIGNTTMKDMDDFGLDSKVKESEEFLCDICLKKFASLKSISVHLRLHMGTYFCSTCKKVFGSSENFKHHKCNQVYSLKCPKCERLFYQKKYLTKHLSVYHNRKFACSSCKKTCYSSAELKNHYCKKSPIEKRRVLKCSKCPKVFNSEQGLRKHQKKHVSSTDAYSIKYICSECSKTFSSKGIYQRHLMAVHSKARGFDCRICDKVFYRRDILKMHIMNFHMMRRNEFFKCPICKKDFKSKKYLNEHIKLSHSEAKHHCKLCTSTFKYSRNLSRHVKLTHSNASAPSENLHECPVCHNKVKLKKSLLRHIRNKHPERYKNLCLDITAKNEEIKHLRYKCPTCQHEVKLKSSLQRHIAKKHPKDFKSLSTQLNESVVLIEKQQKNNTKQFEDDYDISLDLQKTIENMNFNIDTCVDNLLGGSETIDRFLKESSDQISIFLADSPKASTSEFNTTVVTDRITNREVGLSMPDLSDLDGEIRVGRSSTPPTSNIFEPQMTLHSSSDVVLYVLDEK